MSNGFLDAFTAPYFNNTDMHMQNPIGLPAQSPAGFAKVWDALTARNPVSQAELPAPNVGDWLNVRHESSRLFAKRGG
jgi:hypothetical protein